MTLSFRDIMAADPTELDDAAKAFKRMSKRFGELHTDYDTRVRGTLSRSSWAGIAKVSYDEVARVSSGQFDSAKRQAKNITTLLTRAYHDLADREKTLESRVKAAQDDKMSVDGDGRITLDATKLNEGERVARGHDPTYAEALDEEVAAWQSRIDKAVEAVNDADTAVKRTLMAPVEPPDNRAARAHGFNPDKVDYVPPGTKKDADRILRDYQVDPDPDGPVLYPRHPELLVGPLFAKKVRELQQSVTAREADMLDGLGLSGLQDFRASRTGHSTPPTPASVPATGTTTTTTRSATRYWNALMTKKYGAEWAAKYAKAHEARPGNRPEREAMDLYNNEAGRRIAQQHPDASEDELADLVEKAVRDGDLVVIDRGGGRLAFTDHIDSAETGDPKLKAPEKAQEHQSDRNTGGSVAGEHRGE
ncbi:hypothetical protein [Streptomyces sp. 891-h]|uniref:DUF6973 domain-containing protein n=1 Tax=Streptomyces sp. 891-h TaxID=2720714 RepID=UPI001FAA1995|nr:hypothetical protein [Streptomyces sp. 891-h]UNZ21336.1 hypothetical protein HC362_34060 [Streptomyces sp. 891-h]